MGGPLGDEQCRLDDEHPGPCRFSDGGRRARPLVPVVVESPYAGDTDLEVARNLAYLRACMRDCLMRDEAPFASHGLYTQPGVLRDDVRAERELGIRAGFAWRPLAARTVVYVDLGVSPGMERGIAAARDLVWHELEYRQLGGAWAGGGAGALALVEAELERRVFCPECGLVESVDVDGSCATCGACVCTLDRVRAALLAIGLFVVAAEQAAS